MKNNNYKNAKNDKKKFIHIDWNNNLYRTERLDNINNAYDQILGYLVTESQNPDEWHYLIRKFIKMFLDDYKYCLQEHSIKLSKVNELNELLNKYIGENGVSDLLKLKYKYVEQQEGV